MLLNMTNAHKTVKKKTKKRKKNAGIPLVKGVTASSLARSASVRTGRGNRKRQRNSDSEISKEASHRESKSSSPPTTLVPPLPPSALMP